MCVRQSPSQSPPAIEHWHHTGLQCCAAGHLPQLVTRHPLGRHAGRVSHRAWCCHSQVTHRPCPLQDRAAPHQRLWASGLLCIRTKEREVCLCGREVALKVGFGGDCLSAQYRVPVHTSRAQQGPALFNQSRQSGPMLQKSSQNHISMPAQNCSQQPKGGATHGHTATDTQTHGHMDAQSHGYTDTRTECVVPRMTGSLEPLQGGWLRRSCQVDRP